MKKSILRSLYSGKSRLAENPQPGDAECRKMMDDLDDEIAKFPKNEQRAIEKLLELKTQMISVEAEDAFRRGFALGARLAVEVDSIDFEEQWPGGGIGEKKVLKALFNGNLQFGDPPGADNEEYRSIKRKLKDALDTFSDREQIVRLLELQTFILNYDVESAFCRGIAAGLWLMDEVYSIDLGEE